MLTDPPNDLKPQKYTSHYSRHCAFHEKSEFHEQKKKVIHWLCDIHDLDMTLDYLNCTYKHTHVLQMQHTLPIVATAETFKLSNTSVATMCSCCGCMAGRNRIKNTLDLPGQTNRKTDRMFRKVTSAWWLTSLENFEHLLCSAIRHPIIQTSAAGLQNRKKELKRVIT